MPIKVLLLNNISKSAINIFEKNNYIIDNYSKLDTNELKEKIKDYQIIGIRSNTSLTKEVLENANNLLAIGHFCIGTDQTNLEYAASKGIPVFNSAYENTRSVAELVIGYMISLSRKLGDRNIEMHNSKWNKISKNCFELRNKKLGIIGYGSIGTQLGVLAEMLGMNVYYYDIEPKLKYGKAIRVNDLNKLLSLVDFVSLHVPLTQLTKNMFGEDELSCMKKGSYLINASRGQVVNTNAVAKYLNNGHLFGAAFDVYPKEPKKNGYIQVNMKEINVLLNCPNVILTPHIGGSTEEAQTNIGFDVANKIVNYINYGVSLGSVNFPQLNQVINNELINDEPDKKKRKLNINSHLDKIKIFNVHKNKPGSLNKINEIFQNTNISNQILSTRNEIGCTIIEIDNNIDDNVIDTLIKNINTLDISISTRVLNY